MHIGPIRPKTGIAGISSRLGTIATIAAMTVADRMDRGEIRAFQKRGLTRAFYLVFPQISGLFWHEKTQFGKASRPFYQTQNAPRTIGRSGSHSFYRRFLRPHYHALEKV
jgi:hypothetical protein